MNEQTYLSSQAELDALCESALDAGRLLRAELGKRDAPLSEMLTKALTAMSLLGSGSLPSSYRHLPQAFHDFARASNAKSAATAQLAARALVASSFTHPRNMRAVNLPPSILPLYAREFRRILETIRDEGTTIALTEDRWRKNLSILVGRLIPVGAEFADVGSGLPRSTLMRGSFIQRLRVLRCVMTGARGFRPMLELHAHPDSLDDFNPNGWLASYKRLAEILAINPGYKGVIASSWFRDPALSQISPRLSYLREYPETHGALMVKVGTDKEGRSGALTRSPTRRSLFEQGRYIPAIYLMIWPRRTMLAWAGISGEAID
ncbi:hypothetical protein [Azoarcus taiwanensis]|uniref:Uncharacterized protein n=1 Tax=Azoarcus taiwanensis TaxID=666964 RepID=A0A972F5N7_9RHOO|nr:hypothetical protein [Azoarcus taiwanensis]NMG01811.1 hypothetical protein [Azoarcus taiwanensis]